MYMNEEIFWQENIKELLFQHLDENAFRNLLRDLNHIYEQSFKDRVLKSGMVLSI